MSDITLWCVWLDQFTRLTRPRSVCGTTPYIEWQDSLLFVTWLNTYVAVCCSVLQYIASCCRVTKCVAVCRSALQCVAVFCSALQYFAVRCHALPCVALCCSALQYVAVCCSMLQCVTVCCSVLQYVAVRCSMSQCVALCCGVCSMLQCNAVCYSVLQCFAVCEFSEITQFTCMRCDRIFCTCSVFTDREQQWPAFLLLKKKVKNETKETKKQKHQTKKEKRNNLPIVNDGDPFSCCEEFDIYLVFCRECWLPMHPHL